MQQSTSDTIRKLMRLVVTDGYGPFAEVPGYFVGGKTGTAEKTNGHGYRKHANVSAFMSAFPMNEIGQPDFDGHRRHHADMIRKDREFAETRRDAARKVVSAGALGGATIMLYALWDYIKAHLK